VTPADQGGHAFTPAAAAPPIASAVLAAEGTTTAAPAGRAKRTGA
jgi:hypothetical protein